MSAIAILRARTADAHARVDASFSAYRLDEERSYIAFLLAHARALPTAETILSREPGLPAWRPRTALLRRDLATLGAAMPEPLAISARTDAASAWGILYVLEGSRLGGRLLGGRVPAGWSAAYLRAIHEPGEWRATRDAIETQAAAQDADWLDRAVAGARTCFDLYSRAASSA